MNTHARTPVGVVLAVTLLLGLLTGVQALVTAAPAGAAPVTDFDPGNIISDSIMYDSSTMSPASIQSFLEQRGSACVPAAGNTCIKDYRESTPTRAATTMCPGGYVGAANETAASILAKASVACGINPQVLLVTLQKEQGLITSTTGKSASTYSRALGFGCPDNVGGWCNPEYAGFANQVYSAANQLKRYAAGLAGSYRAGRVNTILWNPNAACGSSQVYIENQATASLYNYTPYRPNAAALAAGYGSGDSCSSYGNRNFHLYFTAWFGSAKQRPPIGVIDSVRTSGERTVTFSGWAFDPDSPNPINVHVYVDGAVATGMQASDSRADVGASYGRGAANGFSGSVQVTPGTHTICIYALDATGGFSPLIGCRTVTTSNSRPIGVVDTVQAAGPSSIKVSGWAFDPDSYDPSTVHVYVDGVVAMGANAWDYRPDVGAAYGRGPANGYSGTISVTPGTHTVCVYALDTSGGFNPLIGCRTVTTSNSRPIGVVDTVQAAGPSTIQFSGWAFDPDSSQPTNVHVYVDGRVATGVTAWDSRPDVGAAYGRGPANGFSGSVGVSPGAHTVCVYVLDTSGGLNPLIGCRSVTTSSNAKPIGVIDSVQATGAGSVQLSGWAFDPDSPNPINVHVYVDGVVTTGTTAWDSRPDVGAAYGRGPANGYSATVPVGPGNHTLCVYALDSNGGLNPLIGCRAV